MNDNPRPLSRNNRGRRSRKGEAAIAVANLDHGLASNKIVPPTEDAAAWERFHEDVPGGLVNHLWHKWFDCIPAMQSTAISSNHNAIIQPALPGFNTHHATEKTKMRETQFSIKAPGAARLLAPSPLEGEGRPQAGVRAVRPGSVSQPTPPARLKR